ncbi:hypothetical protein ABC382_00710 [Lysinibacillus sp. 1P01SD]|uniref:hypothetical protein n=1 Tax=Lysinibacillus sp. 1P01SD TaxID=3132285 RepID=UPI00399FED32
MYICTIVSTRRYFKKIEQIGETLEVDGEIYLILGFERFFASSQSIKIHYTVQKLSDTNFPIHHALGNPWRDNEVEVEWKASVKRYRELNNEAILGITFNLDVDGIERRYKIMEYTEIRIDGTDIRISALCRPVYPIHPKEAKAKLMHEKRKRLNIEIL